MMQFLSFSLSWDIWSLRAWWSCCSCARAAMAGVTGILPPGGTRRLLLPVRCRCDNA